MSMVKVRAKQEIKPDMEVFINESVFLDRLQRACLGKELLSFKLTQTRSTSCPTLDIDPRWPCLPLAAYGSLQ